jgi:hypothetical protein
MTTNHTMRTLKLARHTLLVLAVFFYLHPGAVQAAAPHGAGTTMHDGYCNDPDVCNDTVDCSTPCSPYTEDHRVHTIDLTCGTFGNGAADGYCDGGCGDGICNVDVGEPGYCPDDCGYCGDGVCSPWEADGDYYCAADCGDNSPKCTGGDCGGQGSYCPVPGLPCDNGVCTGFNACVGVSACNGEGGGCSYNGDCCSGESCYVDTWTYMSGNIKYDVGTEGECYITIEWSALAPR